MMRRLQAEESLLAYERLGAGTGAFTADWRKRVVKGWEAETGTNRRRRHAPAAPTMLESMGIGYRVAKRRPRTAHT